MERVHLTSRLWKDVNKEMDCPYNEPLDGS